MQVEFEISEDDYVSAGKLFARMRRRQSTYRRVVMPVLWAVSVLAGIVIATSQQSRIGGVTALLVLLIVACCRLLIPWQLRRNYRKNSNLRGRFTLEASSEGVRFHSAISNSSTDWQAYSGFSENDRTFILVYQGGLMYNPVPKRQLNASQVDEMRFTFETYLPRK